MPTENAPTSESEELAAKIAELEAAAAKATADVKAMESMVEAAEAKAEAAEAKAEAAEAKAEAAASANADDAEKSRAERIAERVAAAARTAVKPKRGEIMLGGAKGPHGPWRCFVGGKRIDEVRRCYPKTDFTPDQLKALEADERVEVKKG